MQLYDASSVPDPCEWLALDESERLELIREHHRSMGEELPDEQQNVLHATAHAIVETQLTLEVSPVPETLARLMRQGLNRHDALHAIGAVLMGVIHAGLSGSDLSVNARYAERLGKLSARKWLRGKW